MISAGQLLGFAGGLTGADRDPRTRRALRDRRALAHGRRTALATACGHARSPRRFEMIGGAGGLAMIGVGVTVALTPPR